MKTYGSSGVADSARSLAALRDPIDARPADARQCHFGTFI
jgi:hypothetical protein